MATVSELTSKNIASAQANVQTWGNIVVNVKVYGAKGDGVTDDYSAIISALSSMDYSGILYFPAGTYVISQPIHIGINSSDDAINGFLADGLIIYGAGSSLTIFNKTTATLDKSGKDSIFYTNSIRTHFFDFGATGQGYDSETILFNLRRFSTMSSIERVKGASVKTGAYLDSVYIVKISEFHISSSKQVFDSSTAEKTSLAIDQVWGENVYRFGYFSNINYSTFGTLLCDWANIAAPANPYTNPVTFVDISNGIYQFNLCNTISIGCLANENGNALSFLYYGGSSLNIDFLHLVDFENSSGATFDSKGYTPVVAINKNSGVKQTIIDHIRCTDFTDINLIAYYPYASITYGSKFESYLDLKGIPYDVLTVAGNASTNNLDIMVRHPRSKYPIYWDRPIPDPDAVPYYLKVSTVGAITSQAITYYYYA